MVSRKKRHLPESALFLAACKQEAVLDDQQKQRVRARLKENVAVPAGEKATARILFYLMNAELFDDYLSPQKIVDTISTGGQRFADVTAKPLAAFAERTSGTPEPGRFYEYVRFVALIVHHNPSLLKDHYIKDILDDFHVVNHYLEARDSDEEKYKTFLKTQSSTARPRK